MENIITRTEFQEACDCVDAVSGTMTITRCIEESTARRFPNDHYLIYLEMIDQLNANGVPDSPYASLTPTHRFERNVSEVMALLESDGTLYLQEYRTFLKEDKQIAFVLNQYYGMAWIMKNHVNEAIIRKRQRRSG